MCLKIMLKNHALKFCAFFWKKKVIENIYFKIKKRLFDGNHRQSRLPFFLVHKIRQLVERYDLDLYNTIFMSI